MAVRMVKVSDAGGSLSIEPLQVTLLAGDWVWWRFSNVPAGYVPFIQITSSGRFGPFHSMGSLGNDSVVGKGNTGQAGPYSYRALLLDPATGATITSGSEGTIDNKATEVDTSPEARVVVTPNPDPQAEPGFLVEITPFTLCLNAGDTATWTVSGLQEDMFVTFHFVEDEEGTSSKNRTGPFASFTGMAGGGAGEVRAHATGFMTGAGSHTPPASIPARFRYGIRVWSAAGDPLGGHDPAIDNLGPPIPDY